jgi:uncharacterized protein (TIGR03435 family)
LNRQAFFLVASLFLATRSVPAQAPAHQTPSFDVASVRQNRTGLPPAGDDPMTNVPLGPGEVYAPTGGLLSVRNYPMSQFVAFAYKFTSTQSSDFMKAAPQWVTQDRFDLQARTENRVVTKDELRLMMRTLLAERFGLVVHYETKTTSVFALRLVKPGAPGPRLRPHPVEAGCSRSFGRETADIPPPPDEVDGGYPTTCGGLLLLPSSTPTEFHIGGRDVTLTSIANSMPGWGDLGHPVVDETGLTGSYDFALSFVPKHPDPPPGQPSPPEEQAPNFIESVRKQLGLKLEAEKHDVQVLVLDHIAPLSDN